MEPKRYGILLRGDAQMVPASIEQIQFFHSAGTSTSVDVFLRWHDADALTAGEWRLYGPLCRRTQMLPASFVLETIEPGLWKTTLVDPCYWSPAMPARYRLQRVDRVTRRVDSLREFGLRRLEARRGDLWMDGRRWVLRAVESAAVSVDHAEDLADQQLGVVVGRPAEELLVAAAELGIPLMLRVTDDAWLSPVRRAAEFTAVQLVTLPASWNVDKQQLLAAAPNLLFVAEVTDLSSAIGLDWADALMCRADLSTLNAMRQAFPQKPILACCGNLMGPPDGPPDVRQWRVACERLQRELAPVHDLSGYIVN